MSGNIFGYARVSSMDQNLDRQLVELKKYVPEKSIVVDKASGKDLNRAGYQALKGALGLRPGDCLVIVSLDRLSRNKEDIKNELVWFRKNHIRLKILDLPTSMIDLPENQTWIMEMINNILIEVLSSMAEQERLTIRKRQREGIEAAKLKGRHLGRPALEFPENWELYYHRWENKEITAVVAMREMGVKKSSFYKLVRRYNK